MAQPCMSVQFNILHLLICISAFAYMHLKHNFKQVLHDDHSWNKNPKHQASHLGRVIMSGKAPLS